MAIIIFKHTDITDLLIEDIVNLVGEGETSTNKRRRDFDYFDWKLNNNPFGSFVVTNYIDNVLMSVLTFTCKGVSVFTGNNIYELGDVYVSSKIRGGGVFFRMLRRFHEEFPSVESYGTPNKLALPTELKVGYEQTDIGIRYNLMPLGIPIFTFLGSKITFFRPLHKIDGLVCKAITSLCFFIRDVVFEKEKKEISIDADGFESGLFYKNDQYLSWRYTRSPEPYKFLVSPDTGRMVIYKKILVKNIDFIMIVDHNVKNLTDKNRLLKKLIMIEYCFGIFEMSSKTSSRFLPWFLSLSVKKIDFITYGFDFSEKASNNSVLFNAGDGDNF
jgi:hypothetical protein